MVNILTPLHYSDRHSCNVDIGGKFNIESNVSVLLRPRMSQGDSLGWGWGRHSPSLSTDAAGESWFQ